MNERERMWRLAGRYSSVGIEIAVDIAIGTFGGLWLDRWLGTEPYLFWVGVGVGIGAAVRSVLRVVRSTRLGDL